MITKQLLLLLLLLLLLQLLHLVCQLQHPIQCLPHQSRVRWYAVYWTASPPVLQISRCSQRPSGEVLQLHHAIPQVLLLWVLWAVVGTATASATATVSGQPKVRVGARQQH